MIETGISDIDVDDLMRLVRQEVTRRREQAIEEAPAWSLLDVSLHDAGQHSDIGRAVPGWARYGRLKRKLGQFTAKWILYLADFILQEQRRFNASLLQAVSNVVDTLQYLDRTFKAWKGSATAVEDARQTERERLEARLVLWEGRLTTLEQIKVGGGPAETRLAALDHAPFAGSIGHYERRLALLERAVAEGDGRHELAMEAQFPTDSGRLDRLYAALEDRFRGTREEVLDRLTVYLPFVRKPGIVTGATPLLDVGCGRGEWLELLRSHAVPARGVDTNPSFVQQCLERRLPAQAGDTIAYLRTLPDNSLGALTAFHVIEHLPFARLICLLDEALRVLKPGGLVILETPNPQNILVGSYYFYRDHTRRHLLPSEVVRFLAEARGLSQLEVVFLHPHPGALPCEGSVLNERFNIFFHSGKDYALVGRKP